MVAQVFLAHAPADASQAQELAAFLELGCEVRCEMAQMRSGEDLIDLAEQSAGHLVLLLSKDSWPKQLPRERWDPSLMERAPAFLLLNSCPFPPLLRRGAFFDVPRDGRIASRGLKRWIWQQHRAAESGNAHHKWSADLEPLYSHLADKPGVHTCGAEAGKRFVQEAEDEFERMFWVPCYDRSLAEATGELGEQLDMVLDGESMDNLKRVLDLLASRRCLLVLDAPSDPLCSAMTAFGRTSTLVINESVEVRTTPRTFDHARSLVVRKRDAEAYELLQELMIEGVEPAFCASELIGICEHWGRTEEAAQLRAAHQGPTIQMSLF
jgi:hypothetical protein